MARALRAWAINRGGKNWVRNLRYGPRTRLVRGISFNREENKTIGALLSVSFAEYRSGIKAAAWTFENKNGNVQY